MKLYFRILEFSVTSRTNHVPLLQIQISAYLDNVFDVAALMEDSETKTAALERVAELEDELALVSSPFQSFCIVMVS